MSGVTSIEWTQGADGTPGRTWNPTTGCDRISPGCDHCYALTLAKRLKAMGQARYQADGDPRTSGPGFALTLHLDALDDPRRVRKPTTWFVNSMSDLYHARVPYEFVEGVWATMAATPRHRYQILTKRPDRMARFAVRLNETFGVLPNVWLGTSVESQEYVGRAVQLSGIRAAVRFLSVEPMLGPVDLSEVFDALADRRPGAPSIDYGIQWVIAGGESGPGARPCELDWLRDLRDQCQTARVAFFLKQIGAVAAGGRGKGGHEDAVLDGQRWLEMPA